MTTQNSFSLKFVLKEKFTILKKLLFLTLVFACFNLSAQTNNYSLGFDGVDDYGFLPSSSSIDSLNDFTLMAWFKTNDTSLSNQALISKDTLGPQPNGDCELILFNDKAWFGIKKGSSPVDSASFNATISNSIWYHIAITRNGSTGQVKLYVNGEYDTGFTGYSGIMHNKQPFHFGRHSVLSIWFLNGNMDDISIWSNDLDSTEIKKYKDCPPTGNETDLAGYWNFEEGAGTITTDQTTNGNDCTLIGGVAWSTDVPPYNCCTPNPISSQPTDQSVTIGNNAQFSFTDTLVGAGYRWQIDAGTGYTAISNAGQFSGADSQTLTISSVSISNNNTLYRCIVTESVSCMDTTDIATLTVIETSIKELNSSLVKLFPNPSYDIITLTLAHHSNGQIILTDILGKEVLNKSFSSNQVVLDLKRLSSKGIYFAKVLDLDGYVIDIKKLIYL